MYDTGRRIGEELNIKVKDLFLDVKTPFVIVDGKAIKNAP
jgi:site-specific recombinase XerD